MYIKKSY